LKVMTVVAVVLLPVILAYQAWGYHIFRHRLSLPPVGGDAVRGDGVDGDGAGGDGAMSGRESVVPGSPVEAP
jgi:cytochrome d ubiquinol oxidase subunit II